jgi:F0F1-type ATP synthase membrane subunit b/b'
VAQAATEAQRIVADAQNGAKTAQEGILAQAILEIQRLEESATADTTSSQARAAAGCGAISEEGRAGASGSDFRQ